MYMEKKLQLTDVPIALRAGDTINAVSTIAIEDCAACSTTPPACVERVCDRKFSIVKEQALSFCNKTENGIDIFYMYVHDICTYR